ncbi:hypothetical protein SAMN06269117_11612 [Balnearium lithotrophicum]|uniref:Cysteine peptidase C11 family protein n=1 Tax=Balnearium lithotrophicum TaxID=223788 RepID=A0A521D0V7_9BACT|nr:clostripain-related cysteine peptidase [Balnearium lithotrophicum]SMO64641.1 hypothetical protein SAMN06269117_11612 [Balnearium lithotrophicum]
MLRLLFLISVLIVSYSCGGGGGGSGNLQKVNGQFVSSYVKGLKVCTDSGRCSYTDSLGKFSLLSPSQTPHLTFYIGSLKLGDYTLKENGEVINPFKLAGDSQVGDKLAKIIHGIANDTSGTKELIDLTNLSVSSDDLGNDSLEDAVKSGKPFKISVNNDYYVEFNGTDVELCRGSGTCETVNYRQWLVLVYMMGDNSLSNNAKEDLQEMASVNYTPQVKLVAITDFSDSPDEISISNDTSGKLESFSFPPDTELDLSKEESLKNFISTYVNMYPSSHRALIFWDHGDGWRSSRFAGMDSKPSDYLFMFRVYNVLNQLKNDGITFDLVGFDECLMGMVEVLYDLKDFTENVVASEGYEPENGWDYTKVLSYLVQNPSSDGYTFGKEIVDAYKQTYGNSGSLGYTLTMTLFEKNRINEILSNLENLANNLNSYNFPDFKSARDSSTEVDSNSPYYYVDLYTFANSLQNKYPEASNLVSLINGAYKVVIPGGDGKELHGLSIYFPSSSQEADDSGFSCYKVDTPSVCQFGNEVVDGYYNPFAKTNWDEFLESFIYYSGE